MQINVKSLKASKEDLLKSLKGVYKEQYIVILEHALKAYDFFKQEMKSYEFLIEEVLQQMLPAGDEQNKRAISGKAQKARKNQ